MRLLLTAAVILPLAAPALALDGQIGIHDPSTGIYGDRQTVIDDGVSKRLTLKKGPNIVRCAVVNGGGATDFCARFLDAEDKPVKNLTLSLDDPAH